MILNIFLIYVLYTTLHTGYMVTRGAMHSPDPWRVKLMVFTYSVAVGWMLFPHFFYTIHIQPWLARRAAIKQIRKQLDELDRFQA